MPGVEKIIQLVNNKACSEYLWSLGQSPFRFFKAFIWIAPKVTNNDLRIVRKKSTIQNDNPKGNLSR